jgi:hypothetical protein
VGCPQFGGKGIPVRHPSSNGFAMSHRQYGGKWTNVANRRARAIIPVMSFTSSGNDRQGQMLHINAIHEAQDFYGLPTVRQVLASGWTGICRH